MAKLVEITVYYDTLPPSRIFINTEYVRSVYYNEEGSVAYVSMLAYKYEYKISLADARKLIKAMGGAIQ